jgi:hypothetical protein
MAYGSILVAGGGMREKVYFSPAITIGASRQRLPEQQK